MRTLFIAAAALALASCQRFTLGHVEPAMSNAAIIKEVELCQSHGLFANALMNTDSRIYVIECEPTAPRHY